MFKKLGKFLYEKDIEEIRSIVEYLHFKVVSVVSVIPWLIIIFDERNSIFYPINSKEKFWDSIMLLVFFLLVNMILYIIAGHFILKYIEKIKMQPEKESETSWKKIWENNQDIDVELMLNNLNFDNDDYFSVQVGQVFNSYLSNSFMKALREVIYSNINYYNIWVKEMTFFKAGKKKTFSYKHNGKEIKNLLIHLDIDIPDYIKKENLSSDEFWGSCKDLLSFKIVSLELGKTTLKSNVLGYVVQSEHYELRGVLKLFEKDNEAKEALLTLQEQFKDRNQTLLELTEFEESIKN
jgi:hypothetical protein